MTLKELQAKAKELNIKGRSNMNKAQLEVAIAAWLPPEGTTLHVTPNESPVLAKIEPTAQETFDQINDTDVALLLGVLSKGEARKTRKHLHRQGTKAGRRRADLIAA